MTTVETQPDCLNGPGDCAGSVKYRYPLSDSGKSYPRCEKHWQQRLVRQREIDLRYPFHAPADFDPSYAGERWEDDY